MSKATLATLISLGGCSADRQATKQVSSPKSLYELADPKYDNENIPDRPIYRNSDVTLHLELAQPSTNPASSNERLRIHVVAENHMPSPIDVMEMGLFVSLKCRVLDAAGNDVKLTAAGSKSLSNLYFGGARGGRSTIAPGKQWHRDICVSDYFQTQRGKAYSLQCANKVDIGDALGSRGTYWIESNELDVTP